MLYAIAGILGLLAGIVSANYVNNKRKGEVQRVIDELRRKLTLSKTRRPSRNYKRNGKKKATVIVSKKANVGGKGKAKKAKAIS